MLGEAIQKAQDLHIKQLYAIGEDQEMVISSNDGLPEITINEVTSLGDRGRPGQGLQTTANTEILLEIRGS